MSIRRSLTAGLLMALVACGSGTSRLKVPVGNSPQRGPSDAWVMLVEFADFECPFCRGEQRPANIAAI